MRVTDLVRIDDRLPVVRPQGEVEVLPPADEPSGLTRRTVWPTVGMALVWVARELLPEVINAWRSAQISAPDAATPLVRDVTPTQTERSRPRLGSLGTGLGRRWRHRGGA